MVRIGCLPIADSFSHIQAMACIGTELQNRGHDVIFFGIHDTIKTLSLCPTEFETVTYAEEQMPLGYVPEVTAKGASLSGLASLKLSIATLVDTSDKMLEHATPKIQEANLDILVTDQISLPQSTLGDHLGIPYVSISNALLMIEDTVVPVIFSGRAPNSGMIGKLGTAAETFMTDLLISPVNTTIAKWRAKWNLQPIYRYNRNRNSMSPFATVIQMPEAFDLPYAEFPKNIHRIRRWTLPDGSDGLAPIEEDFPIDAFTSTEEPVVFASLGTMRFNNTGIYRDIITACKVLGVRLVLSTGLEDGDLTEDLKVMRSSTITLVKRCPQAKLMPFVDAVVTHAGLNTTIMALENGVPLVAIPLASDQPAIGARITYHDVGVVLNPANVTALKVEEALRAVLDKAKGYKQRAEAMKEAFEGECDTTKAADVVETVAATKQPLLA